MACKRKRPPTYVVGSLLWLCVKALFRHIAQLPTLAVVVFDHLAHELLCVDGVGIGLIECGVAIVDREAILNHNLQRLVVADVGELHILAVPLQNLMQTLQANSQYTHYDHLVEGASLQEVRCRSFACSLVLLTSTNPILAV